MTLTDNAPDTIPFVTSQPLLTREQIPHAVKFNGY